MSHKLSEMPERIFFDTYPVEVEQPGTWYVGCKDRGLITDPVAYVRADTIEGSVNEPIKEGQHRWVRVYPVDDGGAWEIAYITKLEYPVDADNALVYFTPGGGMNGLESINDVYEWGPVIHKPNM